MDVALRQWVDVAGRLETQWRNATYQKKGDLELFLVQVLSLL